MEADAIGIAAIVVFGVGAQWLGRATGFPSILLLLLAGVLAGPALGIVDPDEIFGEALFPVVSLGVALLLFEEGLKLRFERLPPGTRHPVVRLLTVGVLITAVGAAVAAKLIFDLPSDEAAVLGAILIVSGPTVVQPILRLARPREPVESILSFEGIIVDPIGAMVGIAVLNVVLQDHGPGLIQTAAIGFAAGLAGAAVLVLAMRLLLVSYELEVAVALAVAVAAFTLAEELRSEAGLFATTVMGIALANQKRVPMERIHDFGSTLGAVILGALFIILAARVKLDDVVDLLPQILLFTGILIILLRPITTFVSMAGTKRPLKERILISGIAPRGVVAAATSSLFLLKFEEAGDAFPELVPVTFGVIFLTSLVYGLGFPPLTRLLGLQLPRPRGIAIVGEQPWALDLARALNEADVPVILLPEQPLDASSIPAGVRAIPGEVDKARTDEALGSVGGALIVAEHADRRSLAGAKLT
ncbi:MAG: cation:proton antiporter [Solirubrobacterales bacterium]